MTKGYVVWCNQCNWNVQPQLPDPPKNFFLKFYQELGLKQSATLYRSLKEQGRLISSITPTKVFLYLLAGIVHSLTLIFLVLGIVLLITWTPRVTGIAGAIVCFILVWMLRPRLAKVPSNVLPRESFPAIYQYVDLIADHLKAKRFHYIIVYENFNAWCGRCGLMMSPTLGIGLPLWSILEREERMALIGHELAHTVNGDALRGTFVTTAINSLVTWYDILIPEAIWGVSQGGIVELLVNIIKIPINLVLFGLAKLCMYAAYWFSVLGWRDSQRAEYLADYLAAGVCGTDPMLMMLAKLHYGFIYQYSVQQATVHGRAKDRGDFFDELHRNVRALPMRELERISRVERMELSRLDTTHPPTAYRIGMIEAHRVETPGLQIEPALLAAVDAEMESLRLKIHDRLLEIYHSYLHGMSA